VGLYQLVAIEVQRVDFKKILKLFSEEFSKCYFILLIQKLLMKTILFTTVNGLFMTVHSYFIANVFCTVILFISY